MFVDLTLAFAAAAGGALRTPIGAGKTTLLRLLLGELLPRAGTVRVGGLDPATLSQAGRACGNVPQAPTLFDRSILDNVLYGLEQTPANIAAVQRLFVDYGLVGDPAWSLQRRIAARAARAAVGGGQRRLVALLRLHMAAARGSGGSVGLAIADEPLSNIGGKMRVVAKRLLELISRGRLLSARVSATPRTSPAFASRSPWLPPSLSFTAARQWPKRV